jgi:hypothetical protein
MTSADAARIKATEEVMRWPSALAIGAQGVALATAQLLAHKILPCTPVVDIGFDIVTASGPLLKRVQVKSTQIINTRRSTTFSIVKHKAGHVRGGKYVHTNTRRYKVNEVDAFIFVHATLHEFYVMPASAIDFKRHNISFTPASKWANAWDVLKQP